ncbi:MULTISPECIES: hypothetical protein [Microbulbifer]|uniref:hypothetical protein n=1 Tax=Microbulbifer TaxID=48073 RepID=UPI001F3863C6|nr:hypothetical protein [Microbulbifer zhoushanensis]
MRGWLILLALASLASLYFYIRYQEQQEVFTNTYYFRTLQEVAAELDTRLEQLYNVNWWGESDVKIVSIFPTYKPASDADCLGVREVVRKGEQKAHDSVFTLKGSHVIGCLGSGRGYEVSISDVLPDPGGDFVLYLLADAGGRVLGSTGGASGLSIIDTRAISREIQAQGGQSWLGLVSKKEGPEIDERKELPGHSYYVDMVLSSGASRVYIQPYRLRSGVDLLIPRSDGENGEGFAPSDHLYLIGVLPDRLLDLKEDKRWNLSLLLLSIMFLASCWTVARLVMMSRNEPLGTFFYCATFAGTFVVFIMVVALWLAWGERAAEVARKQANARELLQETSARLESELYWLFRDLESFHTYYARLLSSGVHPEAGTKPEGTPGAAGELRDPGLLVLPGGNVNCRQVEAVTLGDGSGYERPEEAEKEWTLSPDEVAVARSITDKRSEGLLPFSQVYLFGCGARLVTPGEVGERFDSSQMAAQRGPKLINVFLMNQSGDRVLPTFQFVESNKTPISYPLGHRDYFREVRAGTGWHGVFARGSGPAPVSGCWATCADPEHGIDEGDTRSIHNFYIQRLLNFSSGTRGTTVGMPLAKEGVGAADGADWPPGDYILGSDILLPSMTLNEWHEPQKLQDLVLMVVDRSTGDVLFHMDHRRTMVENLFHSGQGTVAISQVIRSGLYRNRAVPGFYRGISGDFIAGRLPLEQWVAVAFIPDDGTDSLMTNFFLSMTAGMGLSLLLVTALLYALPAIFGDPKARLGIPLAINRHNTLLFTSILIASLYLGFRMGSVIQGELGEGPVSTAAPVWAPVIALLLVLAWGCCRYFHMRRVSGGDAGLAPDRGLLVLLTLYFLFGLAIIGQLQRVGNTPVSAMHWYFSSKLYPARLNQELAELETIALTRYPNTIKRFAADPLDLLPISPRWRTALACTRDGKPSNQRHRLPAEIGTFSQLTATTGVANWLRRYVLGWTNDGRWRAGHAPDPCDDVGKVDSPGGGQAELPDASPAGDGTLQLAGHMALYIVLQVLVFLVICRLWLMFYRRVITPRMFGTPDFLVHLKQLSGPGGRLRGVRPAPGLVVDLCDKEVTGIGLDMLVHRAGQDNGPATPVLDLLLAHCPALRTSSEDEEQFPEVRVRLNGMGSRGGAPVAGKAPAICLENIETCLATPPGRARLLQLVRQLKSMQLSGRLSELRLCLESQCFETLLLNAHAPAPGRSWPDAQERAAWAELLMDFTVDLPQALVERADPAFVIEECRGGRLLRYLIPELAEHARGSSGRLRQGWRTLLDRHKTGPEWASILCILLKAGARFRYQWEACSSEEKLALYYLARGKRINPANTQVLEQLAIQGLVRIENGRVQIVNNSFAYFVLNAEDLESMRQLLESGHQGAWLTYRLPVTLVILLLVGAIAISSGNSIYLIVATVMGLLGSIGSLVGSARMIHENLR